MRKEVGSRIKDIFENSDKAEFIEKISVALDTKDSKMVVMVSIPNGNGDLDMNVWQFGFHYLYEEYGFIREGAKILDDCGWEDEV